MMGFQRIKCVRCDDEIEVVGEVEGLILQGKCPKCLKQDAKAEAQLSDNNDLKQPCPNTRCKDGKVKDVGTGDIIPCSVCGGQGYIKS